MSSATLQILQILQVALIGGWLVEAVRGVLSVPRALEPTSLQPLVVQRDVVRLSRHFDARLALNASDPLTEPIRRISANEFGAKPYAHCAVVGNEATIGNSSCGADIDRADLVLRFDFAPILAANGASWAADVGSLRAETRTMVALAANTLRSLLQRSEPPTGAAQYLNRSDVTVLFVFEDIMEDAALVHALSRLAVRSRCQFVALARDWVSVVVPMIFRSIETRLVAAGACDAAPTAVTPGFAALLATVLWCDHVTLYNFDQESACPHWRNYFQTSTQHIALSHSRTVQHATLRALRDAADPPLPLRLAPLAQLLQVNAQCAGPRRAWADAVLTCAWAARLPLAPPPRSKPRPLAAHDVATPTRLFEALDADGNGFLESPSQLACDPFLARDMHREWFLQRDNAELRHYLFVYYDINSDGRVDAHDFVEAFRERAAALPRVREQFNTFADKRAAMRLSDFCHYVQCDVSRELRLDGGKLFAAADLDRSASLDEQEFLMVSLLPLALEYQRKIDLVLNEESAWRAAFVTANHTDACAASR
jgi:hypothetical protein